MLTAPLLLWYAACGAIQVLYTFAFVTVEKSQFSGAGVNVI